MWTAKYGGWARVRLMHSGERFGHIRRLPGFTAEFFELHVSDADLGPSEIFAASEVQSILPLTKEEALAGTSTAIPVSAPVQRPTIGQPVQYLHRVCLSKNDVIPVAAIITGVFEAGDTQETCTLTLFEPGQTPRPTETPIRQGDRPGTWRYLPIQPVAG